MSAGAGVFWKIAVSFLLILSNAAFVAAEFSLLSVRRTRIAELVEAGNAAAKAVERALKNPERFLSSTQLGISISSLALGWIGEPTIAGLLIGPFRRAGLPGTVTSGLAHSLAIALAFAIITYFHDVIGELTPKTMAIHRAEGLILVMAPLLEGFYVLFLPFIWFINQSAVFMQRLLGLRERQKHAHPVHSEAELRMLVRASYEGGVLEAGEQEIVHAAFEFADTSVAEVMVPRREMICVRAEASLSEVLEIAAKSAKTKLPVYAETLDNILGFVHIKDLLRLTRVTANEGAHVRRAITAREIMRPILTVPESKPVSEMLAEFQLRKTQVAIVMDEFGGTAGMVTVEDLLEELVGEIIDEFDQTPPEFENLADGRVRIDGRMLIEDVNEHLELTLPEEDFNTIAGLIFGHLGRTPVPGDEVTLASATFQVEATDGRRATKILYLPAKPEEAPQPEES